MTLYFVRSIIFLYIGYNLKALADSAEAHVRALSNVTPTTEVVAPTPAVTLPTAPAVTLPAPTSLDETLDNLLTNLHIHGINDT